MNKLKKADPEWYNAIVGGTEWEILSSDMDKEEPNAAQIIAIALNKKSQVAMVHYTVTDLGLAQHPADIEKIVHAVSP